MLASYNSSFAKSWGRKVRDVLAQHGRSYFGLTLRRDNKSASEWSIQDHDGGMQASGPGSGTTGKGANCFIIDDPIKDSEEAQSENQRQKVWDWYESTVDTRLQPNGIVIVIQTRWHDDDLAGRLLKAARSGDGMPVSLLSMPALAEENDPLGRSPGQALWPSRFSQKILERKRRAKSSYWWNALYQQRPTQHEGAEWPDEYFGPHLLTKYWPEIFDIGVIWLDPSKGKTDRSDYSAYVFLGMSGGKLWVDCNIARRAVPKMVADGFWFYNSHPSIAFGVESNVFQELLGPEFDRYTAELNVMPLPIHLMPNLINKEVRIQRIGPYLAQKHLRIRDTESGRILVRQLKEFPIGDHDDGPDALEGAIRLMTQITHNHVHDDTQEYDIANV